eukprot:3932288-Rhodomonas_salina.1
MPSLPLPPSLHFHTPTFAFAVCIRHVKSAVRVTGGHERQVLENMRRKLHLHGRRSPRPGLGGHGSDRKGARQSG